MVCQTNNEQFPEDVYEFKYKILLYYVKWGAHALYYIQPAVRDTLARWSMIPSSHDHTDKHKLSRFRAWVTKSGVRCCTRCGTFEPIFEIACYQGGFNFIRLWWYILYFQYDLTLQPLLCPIEVLCHVSYVRGCRSQWNVQIQLSYETQYLITVALRGDWIVLYTRQEPFQWGSPSLPVFFFGCVLHHCLYWGWGRENEEQY